MKRYLVIFALTVLSASCDDGDDLETYCITAVNQDGDRVSVNCAIKERIDSTIEQHPDYTDFQTRLVSSCSECPL